MFEINNNDGTFNIETAVIPTGSRVTKSIQYPNDGEQSTHPKLYKCIPDAKVARKLLRHNGGNRIVDIKPLRNEELDADKKASNFVFEITDKLKADYKEITGFDLRV